jgi:hypothetical protein
VNTQRVEEIKGWIPAIPERIVAYQKGEPTPILTMLSIAHDYLGELLAEVVRLREERDRLADAVTHVLRHGHVGKQSKQRLREALSSLPVREDAPQAAEAGGGKSRRSGEGPH